MLVYLLELTVFLDIFEQTLFVRELKMILQMVVHAESADSNFFLFSALVIALFILRRVGIDSFSVDSAVLALGA